MLFSGRDFILPLTTHFEYPLCERNFRKIYYERWTKGVIESKNVDIALVSSCDEFGLAASLWRIQMVRNFNKLVLASEDNIKAR